jgi:hypothetical protein
MDIVECLSSSAFPERPLALIWEGQRLEIGAILSQWRTPEALWFRVQTRDLRTFDLAFFKARDCWQITPISGG